MPAYKGRFLVALLDSLAAQTSADFRVIVADDASPEQLRTVCEAYANRLNLRYVRFESNFGGSDLMEHWNRSVRLSDAKWVLLPGDDDVLDRNCIEAFWRSAAEAEAIVDVFYFGIRVIDEHGKVIRETRIPKTCTAAEYLLLVHGGHVSPMPVGYIFARDAYDRCGGFVSFDNGWFSDGASWALFGARAGLRPIDGASVSWRQSNMNITTVMTRDRVRRALVTVAYLSWVNYNRDRLNLEEHDVRNVVNKLIWCVYPTLSGASLRDWLTASLQASSGLRHCTEQSRLHHLYRFALYRWRRHLP